MKAPTAWWELATVSYRSWNRFIYSQEAFFPYLPMSKAELDGLSANAEQTFKHDKTTTVSLVDVASMDMVLKRYNLKSVWHGVNRLLRKTRARRCWEMSRVFARAGLNVAQPIMMYEQRLGPFRGTAYFVTSLLDGEELLTLLPSLLPPERRIIIDAVKSAFKVMEAANLSHGDLKASNLLWVENELFFVDMDAAKHHLSDIGWRRAHAKDRNRFLKNWQDFPDLLEEFADL